MDPVLAAAVEPAQTAILETTDASNVGEHLAVRDEGPNLVLHAFASRLAGYRGWYWAVSLSRSPKSENITVNEVVLLPGEQSISAPQWTPYKQRVESGDLQPGDVLPPESDDPRLVPAWSAGDNAATAADIVTAREHGLGRTTVLSLQGRAEAAARWYASAQGPDAAIAQQAPGSCHTCGFLVRLAGPLATRFGVCANGLANDDGRVVALSHGCGAHSGVAVGQAQQPQNLPEPVFDTVDVDIIDSW